MEAYDKVKLLLKHGADPLFVAKADAKGRPGGFLTMEDIVQSSCPRKIYKKMLKAGVPWKGEEGPRSDDKEYSEDDSSNSEEEEEEEQ